MNPVTAPEKIYIRLPAPGKRCPHTGLSRTTLNNLVLPSPANGFKPPVSSKVIKAYKFAQRGIRLISYQSLISYIDGLPDGGLLV